MAPQSQFWWVRWFPVAVLLLVCGFLAVRIWRGLLAPLVLSAGLAVMLDPLAHWFERRGVQRVGAVLLSLGMAAVTLAVLLLLLLPGIWAQLGESIEKLPLALAALLRRGALLMGWIREHSSPELFGRLGEEGKQFEADPSALRAFLAGWLSVGAFGLVDAGSGIVGLGRRSESAWRISGRWETAPLGSGVTTMFPVSAPPWHSTPCCL